MDITETHKCLLDIFPDTSLLDMCHGSQFDDSRRILESGIGTSIAFSSKYAHYEHFFIPFRGSFFTVKKKFNTNPRIQITKLGNPEDLLKILIRLSNSPLFDLCKSIDVSNLDESRYASVKSLFGSGTGKREAGYDLLDDNKRNLVGSDFRDIRNRIRKCVKRGISSKPLSNDNFDDAMKVFEEWKSSKSVQYKNLWENKEDFKGSGGFASGERAQLASGMYKASLELARSCDYNRVVAFVGYLPSFSSDTRIPVYILQGFVRSDNKTVDLSTSIICNNELTKSIKVGLYAINHYLNHCRSLGYHFVNHGDYDGMAAGVKRTKSKFLPDFEKVWKVRINKDRVLKLKEEFLNATRL